MKDPKALKESVVGRPSAVVSVSEGARRATGEEETTAARLGPLGAGQRWTAARKREVILRLLRGEPMEAISRELGVELFRLDSWLNKAFAGIDATLKERSEDPISIERDKALQRIGELTMENELLRARCGVQRPFNFRRSRK